MFADDVDVDFDPVCVAAARALGLASPVDVAAVLFAESGIKSIATNTWTSTDDAGVVTTHHCYGINQFCDTGTYQATVDLAPADYLTLPPSAQLRDYVLPFWLRRLASIGQPIATARDLYWINAYPATYRPGAGDDAVVIPHVGDADRGLSRGKSFATAADLDAFMLQAQRRSPRRWNEIRARLEHLVPAPVARVPAPAPSSSLAFAAAVAVVGFLLWRTV